MEGTKNNYNIPNLFIVGAPKCGTTSMHNWLSQHPEIFMSEPKEPFYFCKDIIREADEYNKKATFKFQYRDEENYFSLFEQATNEKYRGEASTRYLYSKIAPSYIRQFSPKAKIIIMLREPVNFMYSWHSHKIRGGTEEDIENFEKALEAEKERKEHKKMPNKVVCPSDLFYSELAHFSSYITNYQKHFPKEQIKIIILEEIKQDPGKIYREILEFLQVEDTQFSPDFEILNRNSKLRSKYLNDLIKNSKYIKRAFRLVTPDKIRRKITSTLERMNKKTVERDPMPSQTKKELMTKFKPEVKKMEDIIDKDLISLWGYNNIE